MQVHPVYTGLTALMFDVCLVSQAWSFPDMLELGVPGYGSYTWNEAQSVLSLFAVTSSPLMLGNDARPGRMQQRVINLLLNPDLLAANAYYSQTEKFAGGRIWSGQVSPSASFSPPSSDLHFARSVSASPDVPFLCRALQLCACLY